MTSIRFIAVRDSETGGIGLTPFKNQRERFTSDSSLALAHDIVEHQHGLNNIGTIHDELIALGAVCVTRAHTFSAPSRTIAVDIIELARVHFALDVPFKTRRAGKSYDHGYEHQILGVLAEVISYYKDNPKIFDIPKEKFPDKETFQNFILQARTYMNQGANLCLRRWGDEYHAFELFKEIQRASSHYFEDGLIEGQHYRLLYRSDPMSVDFYEINCN